MRFARFDIDAFLADHWQKAPLLIRNPWADWRNPIEADDLAGLACEEDVESRLVTRTRQGGWALDHGPFTAKRFAALGKTPWTLLVQGVDVHAPDVAALIEPFRFISDWRIDDVMVSVAGDGGGVGPHFDQYDVFLIQGAGRRRWRVGARCDADAALLPHDDLRLLADFTATDEWVLDPGDMLYVPPGFAHDGVALGDDCMTYSIGFRAPSRGDLVSGWADHLAGALGDDDRYADPGARAADNPGEIGADAIAALHAMTVEALGDRAGFARWFGQYATTPKDPELDFAPETPVTIARVRAFARAGAMLSRNPASRFAFARAGEDAIALFVDGACMDCAGPERRFAEALCAQTEMTVDPGMPDAVAHLIVALVNRGSVAFDDDD